jgi:uncharacterized membrane protein
MDSRILRIVSLLAGMVAVVASLRLLLRHQYTYAYRNFPLNDPPIWRSTFFLLLAGVWFFVFGLIGLIYEKQRKNGNPKT